MTTSHASSDSAHNPVGRTLAILAAAMFAIGIVVVQTFGALGQNPEDFAADGDRTLKAAEYAFAIWGPIYLGLALYAVFQALPRTPNHESLERFGWPSVVAMTGCGLWLIAAAHDMQWATVLIIVASAGALTAPLLKRPAQPTPSAFWLIEAPLALLAGWLTIASAINLLTVLTAEGFIENALLWAAIGIVAVAAITGLIGWRSLAPFYLPPVVWGLIGVAVAEAARKPQISWLALGAALALAGLAAAVVHRRQALR